jgi:hypothetical protein
MVILRHGRPEVSEQPGRQQRGAKQHACIHRVSPVWTSCRRSLLLRELGVIARDFRAAGLVPAAVDPAGAFTNMNPCAEPAQLPHVGLRKILCVRRCRTTLEVSAHDAQLPLIIRRESST